MNPYAVAIVAALLLEYGLTLVAELLNLRALRPELPDELADTYDAETYRRSQEYTRATARFGMVPSTVGLLLVLGFWALGGFAALDDAVRGLGWGPTATGVLFIGALLLGKGLVMLPFSWYSTFVIEERFGFNRTTQATWWADRAKGLLLGLLLGAPLLAAVLLFFERTGDLAWLWAWIAVTVFTLAIQYVAPTWILPLFNKFQPLEEGELKRAILGYAQRVDFPLRDLFVIDGSKRSTKANAFFTGFGKNKRVALFDTLIENHSTDELVGVVAHEIGHFKRKHILQGTAIGIAHTGALLFLLSLFLTQLELFEAFGVAQPSVWAGLVFFGLLYTPVELGLSVLMSAFSRKNEYEADAYAAETTGAGETLAAALKKLSKDNLANLTPHPFYVVLHHSHPPLLQRIAALRAAAR